ncbi:glutamate racemase [Salmonella enterica subsp. arizonae]|nr:glutamate racemase [Salmonella enterica subsp. arizonae]
MATKLQDENTPCLAATPSEPRPTVLVFDSGVGGLSVYDEIRRLLPDLHYIYAFDNVAFPYGEKSETFIVERVVEIVTAVQQRYPLSLAVIACNTASTVSLPHYVKSLPSRWWALYLRLNQRRGLPQMASSGYWRRERRSNVLILTN